MLVTQLIECASHPAAMDHRKGMLMEFIPVNATIHYKCAFDVYGTKSDEMTSLRRILRSWCLRKTCNFSNDGLHSAWFFRGDQNQHRIGNVFFRSAINVGSSTLAEPDNWALEVIHPDLSNRHRKWSIEITLSKRENSYIRFVTTTKHWMNEGYIGPIPDDPAPSVPAYVRSIIEADDFTCRKGDESVSKEIKEIDVGEGKFLSERVISDDRFLPIIVVSRAANDNSYRIDTELLHSKLLGNANVYLLKNEASSQEFNYFAGSDFQCLSGSLRIYMPKVRRDRPSDSYRHRYYSERQLLENDSVSSEIILGLSRNARTFALNEIISIQDIISQNRKFRIHQLFANRKEDQNEELALLWDEIEDLDKKLSESENLAQLYETENEELKQENSNLRWKANQTESLRIENDDLKNRIQSFELLDHLPSNLSDVVDFMKNAYKDRLFFTDRAIKSSREYEHSNDVFRQSWEIFRSMAVVLYKLIFEDRPGNLEDAFRNETGFELAMTEGRQTKKDANLMNLRKVTYKEKEVDITPHIKYGNRHPHLLRIHFYPDMDIQLLVIGHCGGHLNNFSTRAIS